MLISASISAPVAQARELPSLPAMNSCSFSRTINTGQPPRNQAARNARAGFDSMVESGRRESSVSAIILAAGL